MPQQHAVHDQQSLVASVYQLVSQKLVYSSLIFVDSKLALSAYQHNQQLVTVSLRNTQVILLIW